MTLNEARTKNMDVYFFGNEAARDGWCAGAEEATGRGTVKFDEFVGQFRIICAAITKRPRPIVRLVED